MLPSSYIECAFTSLFSTASSHHVIHSYDLVAAAQCLQYLYTLYMHTQDIKIMASTRMQLRDNEAKLWVYKFTT
jgi:hypothetical protein